MIEYLCEVKDNRQEPIFYGGEVVHIHYKGGIIILLSDGVIRLHIKDQETGDHVTTLVRPNPLNDINDELLEYGITNDEVLRDMIKGTHDKYVVEIEDKPWWGIEFEDNEGELFDLLWAAESSTLSEAIEQARKEIDMYGIC